MTRRPALATSATVTVAANVLSAVLGVLTGTLAARLLGPTGRGELAAIQLWPTMIATFAMLGLAESIVYFSARGRAKAGEVVATAVFVAAASSCFCVVVGIALLPYLMVGQRDDLVSAACWYLAIVPTFAFASLPYHVLRGREDFVAWNVVRLCPTAVWLVVLVVGWLVGMSLPEEFAWGLLVANAALGVITWKFITSRVGGVFAVRRSLIRPLLGYGLPSLSTTGPSLLAMRTDQVLLVAFFSTATLGLYVVALAWAGAVAPLLSAVGAVIFPRVAALQDGPSRAASFVRGIRVAIIVSAASVLPVAILAPFAIPLLFGKEFSGAAIASAILAVGAGVTGVTHVMEEGLRGLGRPGALLLGQVAGIPVTALGMVIMLPTFGLEGASCAAVGGAIVTLATLTLVTGRELNVPVLYMCLPTMDEVRILLGHGQKMAALGRRLLGLNK